MADILDQKAKLLKRLAPGYADGGNVGQAFNFNGAQVKRDSATGLYVYLDGPNAGKSLPTTQQAGAISAERAANKAAQQQTEPATGNQTTDPNAEPGTGNKVADPNAQSNIKSGLNSLGGAMTNAAAGYMSMGAKDPTSPGNLAEAELHDQFGQELKEHSQGEYSRGSRNINAEASERAATEGAAENAQAVSQLQGAAGGGAAALKRTVKTPDVGKVKTENAELRKTGFAQEQNADTELIKGQALRTGVDAADAAARDRMSKEMQAGAIAKGAPDDVVPEDVPPGDVTAEETPGDVTAEETPGDVTAEETPGDVVGGGGDKPEQDTVITPEVREQANQRVKQALSGAENATDYQTSFDAGVKAFVAAKDGDNEAWNTWKDNLPADVKEGAGAIGDAQESRAGEFQGKWDDKGAPIVPSTVEQSVIGLTPTTRAKGGYTGEGAKYAPAGVVHKGEYVIPKEGVNQKTKKPDIDYVKKIVSDYRVKQRSHNIAGAIRRRF